MDHFQNILISPGCTTNLITFFFILFFIENGFLQKKILSIYNAIFESVHAKLKQNFHHYRYCYRLILRTASKGLTLICDNVVSVV